MSRFVGAVVLSLATFGPAAVVAQSGIPAEFPPPGYDENQYVDSRGCAFIRAGISGVTNWVPRMARTREPLCGFQPTFAQAPEPEPTPAPAPVVAEADPEPAPQPAPQPAPAARPAEIAQAPAPAPRPAMPRNPLFGGPIETVASVVTPPNLGAQANAPARVDAPRDGSGAAAPDVRTITLAEACDGRTGIQPRLINSRTGAPIDCGPAAAPVVTPVSAPSPASGAEAGVLRLTLSEICARSAAEGTRFVNAETGAPIACPAAPTVIAGAAPAAPAGPAGPVVPAAPTIAPAVAQVAAPVVAAGAGAASCVSARLAASSRGDVRCGPQTQSPSGYSPAANGTHSVARSPAGAAVRGDIPASNPSVAVSAPTAPPSGYRSVWDDGRVNLQRGLSAASVAPVPPSAAPEARVSSRNAPPQQAPAHRYVQVGTYGEPANAERAAARLRALGLPVGFAQITRDGQPLQVVAAGPFASSAQLQSALNSARAAGYGDAFTRR